MKSIKVNKFLESITRWTTSQPDILALALVGSHARETATDTSDIDLILITLKPDTYISNSEWVKHFGTIEKKQIELYGLVISIRVWYLDGLEVEYSITDRFWIAEPLDVGTQRVINDGMQILFERNNILSAIK